MTHLKQQKIIWFLLVPVLICKPEKAAYKLISRLINSSSPL